MYIDLTPEQRALRDELRGYFQGLVTDALRASWKDSRGRRPRVPAHPEAARRRRLARHRLAEGVRRAGPLGDRAVHLRRGGAARRLPAAVPDARHGRPDDHALRHRGAEAASSCRRSCAGDLHFAIGYSEPEAGTDLASLKTRAVRDGDEWVINGSKVFTSLADYADYIWLAARTDPQAPKHRGISMFMVPTTAPGFKCTPIWTMGGVRTNATYYENVRVPHENLIGGENGGWGLITGQLNFERVSLVNASGFETMLDELIDVGEGDQARRRPPRDRPALGAAEPRALPRHVEVLKLMNWKQAWASTQGMLHPAEASAAKVFGTEMAVQIYEWMMEVIGQAGTVKEGSPEARPARPPRAHVPRGADPDLRRRHQRGPARHHRDGRPRHARTTRPRGVPWTGAIDEDQQALARARAQDPRGARHPRAAEADRGDDERVDRALWAELAKANLLGVPFARGLRRQRPRPLRAGVLLEEIGRAVAPVPVFATVVLAGLADRASSAATRSSAAGSPRVASGEVILTAALSEPLAERPGGAPTPRRGATAPRGCSTARKGLVPAAHVAERMLVPAASGSGVGALPARPARRRASRSCARR